MNIVLIFSIFIISCFLIIFSSRWVIDALHRLTKRLGWKEFVVAFFTASVGAVIPELIIGIRAALKGIPDLALGNIVGQNIILFTLSVSICVFFLKEIVVESRTVRAGTTFALLSVVLPFILLWNGVLSRIDGVILILAFCIYVYWLFSDKDRFLKDYKEVVDYTHPVKDFFIIISGLFLVIVSAEGIVFSAEQLGDLFNVPIMLIGLFAVGFGVALPETFFSIALARKGQSWMILGGLMGAVAISSTLVLGTVALIHPIVIDDFSPFIMARTFIIAGGAVLLFFVRTHNKITRREALVLFSIYLLFLFLQFA